MKKAFTYIEVLLYTSILSIVFGFSMPVYQSLQNRNDLEIAINSTAQSYRRAEVLAQGSEGDSTWGVQISSGMITIFKGATYGSRDVNFDETITISPALTLSGNTEVIFAKMTGYPNATSSLTMTTPNSDSKTITINSKGIVNY